MTQFKRTIAAAELLLIFPAVLFMTALFVRSIQPIQYEPARTAEQIVSWYAARPRVGLWLLLIALPLTVLATGCLTLLRAWKSKPELRRDAGQVFVAIRGHLATLFVAVATLTAAGILAIVAFHMMTN